MQIYMVGGAVRDALLGLPVQDHDWVVVGSSPEELAALGYLPVGKDFPVFLHPTSHEEYALARTERKTARGYRGFEVYAAADVTLEQDLARRDLTINSIAAPARPAANGDGFDADLGALVDPYGGQQDLRAKVLRHVTLAFREDPVRILRLARFAARFTDFSVAPETMRLMQHMVKDGEVDALVAERVWQELARGLMQARPSRMLEVLRDCGALHRLLPEIGSCWRDHSAAMLDLAAQLATPLPVRFACMTMALPAQPLKALCERLRAPLACKEMAEVAAREHECIAQSEALSPAALVRLLERCDAFRKPQRFADLLLACQCEALARSGLTLGDYPQRARLLGLLAAAQAVDTQAVATQAQASGQNGKQIGEMVYAARVAAIEQAIKPAIAQAAADGGD